MDLHFGKWRRNRSYEAASKAEVIASVAIVILVAALATGMVWWVRLPKSPFLTISLSAHTNGALDQCWVPGGEPDNHLKEFPRGRSLFQSVPFDVRGLVQLQGQTWKGAGHTFQIGRAHV